MTAFKLAYVVRMRRAEIKRSLKARETTLAQHITESSLRTARVREVLGWQPRWGPIMVSQTIGILHAYNPTCGQLSPRQVAIVVDLAGTPTGLVAERIRELHRIESIRS